MTIVPPITTYVSLFKHIKNGGAVTIMTDQHAVPPEGINVPLLGQDAWTHATFVKMSIKTGAPIVPAYMFVKGYSKYVIKFGEAVFPEAYLGNKDPVYDMTLACNKALGCAIKTHPELWMWQHRRFKSFQ